MIPNSTPAPQTPTPPKAIPPNRDRLQSRLLVWIVAPLIFMLTVETFTIHIVRYWSWQPQWQPHYLEVVAISVVFGALVLLLRAATPAAATCGAMICFLLTWHTGWVIRSPLYSALTPLLALFILTFTATRAGRHKKLGHGIAESHKGRNAAQVTANLGIAALLTSQWARNVGFTLNFLSLDVVFLTAVLAALAEATADTVSSEIGHAFGTTPIMLTTLRRVPPGTDGAISLIGTVAGILAATIVAGVGAWSMHLHADQFCIALIAGTCGLFFDSLLGATVERRGYIGNDLVNFTSTAFAAAFALVALTFGPSFLLN